MKLDAIKGVIGCFAILQLALSATVNAASEVGYEVEFTNLTIYRDGLVHLTEALIVNEAYPEITLPLLCASIENLIALDEDQRTLDCVTSGTNLTIFTMGAKSIFLEYDTISLTKKQAEMWTFNANCSCSLTVFLPENSTIVYMNQMPTAIDSQSGRIALSLFSGYWEISYILPLLPQDESTNQDESPTTIPIEYLVIAAVIVTMAFPSTVMLVRRRRGPNIDKMLKTNPQLTKEDKEVIRFLAEKKGQAFEAEIRKQFPDMPRTSLWRLVRRLERLELVEVKKVGLENRVELKK